MAADIQTVDGHWQVRGELTFETVPDLLGVSLPSLTDRADTPIDIDLSAVDHVDSAGLALLVRWHRLACAQDRVIRFHHLPQQLTALARVSNLDQLLTIGWQSSTTAARPTGADD